MMSTDKNQNPEQIVHDKIDTMLREAGRLLQSKKGVAIREYQADSGFTDYVLFVNRKPVELLRRQGS
jgi:type I restriction enzyme R subunit